MIIEAIVFAKEVKQSLEVLPTARLVASSLFYPFCCVNLKQKNPQFLIFFP